MSLLHKPAATSVPINELLRNRWSPRAFADRAVPAEALRAVLEAGRWAASSNNGQPWRWLVATKADIAAHSAAVAGFVPRNQRWAKDAPVLIFACARKTFEANGSANAHAWYDTGAASAQMTVEAEARGLRFHQAAGIERDKIREAFGVPDDFDICTGMALGYQGEPDQLPEDLPAREREPRMRKPLEDLAFSGRFGVPVKL